MIQTQLLCTLMIPPELLCLLTKVPDTSRANELVEPFHYPTPPPTDLPRRAGGSPLVNSETQTGPLGRNAPRAC